MRGCDAHYSFRFYRDGEDNALHHWRCSATMTQASLDQKLVLRGNALFLISNAEEPVLVFVMVTDSLPSVLRVLVTFFLLPSASALNLENDSLPSALWVLVTLCLLPNASLVNLEIDSLPSELRVLVTLCLLPNASV